MGYRNTFLIFVANVVVLVAQRESYRWLSELCAGISGFADDQIPFLVCTQVYFERDQVLLMPANLGMN